MKVSGVRETYESDQVDVHLLRAKSVLKLSKVDGGNSLGVDLDSGLEFVEITLRVGFLEQLPSLLIVHLRHAEVELAWILALRSDVAFLSTILTDRRRLLGTFAGWVTFLVADTAGAGERTLDARVGAVGLVVSV